jgi:hypothetical protein
VLSDIRYQVQVQCRREIRNEGAEGHKTRRGEGGQGGEERRGGAAAAAAAAVPLTHGIRAGYEHACVERLDVSESLPAGMDGQSKQSRADQIRSERLRERSAD